MDSSLFACIVFNTMPFIFVFLFILDLACCICFDDFDIILLLPIYDLLLLFNARPVFYSRWFTIGWILCVLYIRLRIICTHLGKNCFFLPPDGQSLAICCRLNGVHCTPFALLSEIDLVPVWKIIFFPLFLIIGLIF